MSEKTHKTHHVYGLLLMLLGVGFFIVFVIEVPRTQAVGQFECKGDKSVQCMGNYCANKQFKGQKYLTADCFPPDKSKGETATKDGLLGKICYVKKNVIVVKGTCLSCQPICGKATEADGKPVKKPDILNDPCGLSGGTGCAEAEPPPKGGGDTPPPPENGPPPPPPDTPARIDWDNLVDPSEGTEIGKGFRDSPTGDTPTPPGTPPTGPDFSKSDFGEFGTLPPPPKSPPTGESGPSADPNPTGKQSNTFGSPPPQGGGGGNDPSGNDIGKKLGDIASKVKEALKDSTPDFEELLEELAKWLKEWLDGLGGDEEAKPTPTPKIDTNADKPQPVAATSCYGTRACGDNPNWKSSRVDKLGKAFNPNTEKVIAVGNGSPYRYGQRLQLCTSSGQCDIGVVRDHCPGCGTRKLDVTGALAKNLGGEGANPSVTVTPVTGSSPNPSGVASGYPVTPSSPSPIYGPIDQLGDAYPSQDSTGYGTEYSEAFEYPDFPADATDVPQPIEYPDFPIDATDLSPAPEYSDFPEDATEVRPPAGPPPADEFPTEATEERPPAGPPPSDEFPTEATEERPPAGPPPPQPQEGNVSQFDREDADRGAAMQEQLEKSAIEKWADNEYVQEVTKQAVAAWEFARDLEKNLQDWAELGRQEIAEAAREFARLYQNFEEAAGRVLEGPADLADGAQNEIENPYNVSEEDFRTNSKNLGERLRDYENSGKSRFGGVYDDQGRLHAFSDGKRDVPISTSDGKQIAAHLGCTNSCYEQAVADARISSAGTGPYVSPEGLDQNINWNDYSSLPAENPPTGESPRSGPPDDTNNMYWEETKPDPPTAIDKLKYDADQAWKKYGWGKQEVPKSSDVPRSEKTLPDGGGSPDSSKTQDERLADLKDKTAKLQAAGEERNKLLEDHVARQYADPNTRDPRLDEAEARHQAAREEFQKAYAAAKNDLPGELSNRLDQLAKNDEGLVQKANEARTGFGNRSSELREWAEANGKTTIGSKSNSDVLWQPEKPNSTNVLDKMFPVYLQTTAPEVRYYLGSNGEVVDSLRNVAASEQSITSAISEGIPPPVPNPITDGFPDVYEPSSPPADGLPPPPPSSPPAAPPPATVTPPPAVPPPSTTAPPPATEPPPPSTAPPPATSAPPPPSTTPPPTPGPGTTPPPGPGGGDKGGSGGVGSGSGGGGGLGMLGGLFEQLKNLFSKEKPKPTQQPQPQPAPFLNSSTTPAYSSPTESVTLNFPAKKTTSTGPAPKAVVILIANPSKIAPGASVRLAWSSVHTESCDVFDNVGNMISENETDGTVRTLALMSTTKFGIECEVEDADPITAYRTVTVEGAAKKIQDTKTQKTAPTKTAPKTQTETEPETGKTPAQTTPDPNAACDPSLPYLKFIACVLR